jgi:hypothetical protein
LPPQNTRSHRTNSTMSPPTSNAQLNQSMTIV